MNYYLWISGTEHGPYTLEQVRAAVADGAIKDQQTARTEDSSEWKPLSQIAHVSEPMPASPAPPVQASSLVPATPLVTKTPGFQSSSLVGVLQYLAVFDFIAAGIGGLVAVVSGRGVSLLGIVLFAYGIGSGFLLLGFAAAIDSLQEMVFRLRNLERLAASSDTAQRK